MKRSYMYEKCHELGGFTVNSNMTLEQWFIMSLNCMEPFVTPSIIMIRHEEK